MIVRTARHVCNAVRRRGPAAAVCAGAMLSALTPGVAGSTVTTGAGQAWYERSFVVAADRKCDLFSPELGAALQASALQARGAAARAGETHETISAGLARAEGLAAATPCDDPDLAVVRERAEKAFGAWTGMRRMEFAGARNQWKADRTLREADAWRLAQTSGVGGAKATFGLLARAGAAETSPAVAVSFPGRSRPYAVRLAMRDASRVNLPWLKADGAEPPPEWARLNVLAGASVTGDTALVGAASGEAVVWFFPQEAAADLARLDPRETFVVEFVFRDESVARVRFEVGDFAAGRAFAGLGAV